MSAKLNKVCANCVIMSNYVQHTVWYFHFKLTMKLNKLHA